MEYMHEGVLPLEKTRLIDEDSYPILLNNIMQYITKMKQDPNNKDLTLVDIIVNFSIKENISVELIGDAIKDDEYFKQFLEVEINMKKETFDW